MAQPPGTVPSACVMERWLKSKHGEMAVGCAIYRLPARSICKGKGKGGEKESERERRKEKGEGNEKGNGERRNGERRKGKGTGK